MAQAGAILLSSQIADGPAKVPVVARINDVRFKRQVRPGETLRLLNERLYGQHDHVRQYGRDYQDRLAEAGFSVTVDDFAREIDAQATRRLGLTPGEAVYFCRKAAA